MTRGKNYGCRVRLIDNFLNEIVLGPSLKTDRFLYGRKISVCFILGRGNGGGGRVYQYFDSFK